MPMLSLPVISKNAANKVPYLLIIHVTMFKVPHYTPCRTVWIERRIKEDRGKGTRKETWRNSWANQTPDEREQRLAKQSEQERTR